MGNFVEKICKCILSLVRDKFSDCFEVNLPLSLELKVSVNKTHLIIFVPNDLNCRIMRAF